MGRKVRRVVVGVAVALLCWIGLAAPAGAQAGGRIPSYDVDLVGNDDGTLNITETIDYDFDGAQRHGIFREIPVRFHYDDRYDRIYPLKVESVTATPPGTPTNVKVETEGQNKTIRIGDPDRTVTGAHTYRIAYTVRGALNGFKDHDELFWNAIGEFWSVPIERATARVTVPAAVGQVACFAGPAGSRLACSQATADGRQARFTQSGLGSNEALTV